MNDKITALVLKITDYKENDLILEVISKDKSFLSLVAKGAKKIDSKKHYYPLCLYEFIIDYKDHKNIFLIHNSKLLETYFDDNDLKLLSYKNIIVEATLKAKELYELKMYDSLIFTLKNMNIDNMYLLGCLYFGYLLKINGISPNVDGCVVCGNTSVVSISNRLGGFVCLKHLNGLDSLDVEKLRKFRLINKADFNYYEVLKDIEYDLEDFKIIINFYETNMDIILKAYKLFCDLFKD